jgi:hypothetical protein
VNQIGEQEVGTEVLGGRQRTVGGVRQQAVVLQDGAERKRRGELIIPLAAGDVIVKRRVMRRADLAFDPNYCVLMTGICGTGSYSSLNGLTTAQQLKFFQPTAIPPLDGSGVGLGHLCGGSGAQSSANGDCSYQSAINLAHGYRFNPAPPP